MTALPSIRAKVSRRLLSCVRTGFALNEAGQLVANGTFTGTATTAAGVTNLVDAVVSTVVAPAGAGPGCPQNLLNILNGLLGG